MENNRLVDLLREALRRAESTPEHLIPAVRFARALDAVTRAVLPAFPPEPEHRDVTTLTGGHADSVELRGFGSESDPD